MPASYAWGGTALLPSPREGSSRHTAKQPPLYLVDKPLEYTFEPGAPWDRLNNGRRRRAEKGKKEGEEKKVRGCLLPLGVL